MNRVIRACVELGPDNPIVSIHDQGCAGNSNVLKEIVETSDCSAGADIEVRNITCGDKTMSVLEIWGAEYQESNALLCRDGPHVALLKAIAAREQCPIDFVGRVTDTGSVRLHDATDDSTPVDMPMALVLGKMPRKTFVCDRVARPTRPLALPAPLAVAAAADRVLRLLSVGSKRFLVHKVDRSVTGLVAQQQCVGPLQLPLADCAVLAHSHLDTTGTATSCGERPIVGLLDPAAMARLVVGETLTNLVWAAVSSRTDIKASGNWMWAPKLKGEGARMWDACVTVPLLLLLLPPPLLPLLRPPRYYCDHDHDYD